MSLTELKNPVRALVIVVDPECKSCFGCGLRINQSHNPNFNQLIVSITVCSCARLQPQKKQPNQFSKKE